MEQNENKIIIIDEQGRERVCEILFTYQHPETQKNYVVLYPIDELDTDDEEMDLFAYSFIENENGDGELFTLETDEEYDMINEVIDQFYEDQLEGLDEE